MMEKRNKDPINGQSENSEIDRGHDQQSWIEGDHKLADAIEQALDRTDSEGGKWKQQFEKEWGCQVFVVCNLHPLKVALVVLPLDMHPQKEDWRFKFWVDLPEVQNAAWVWPAIEARAERLEELGRFHQYVDWFYEVAEIHRGTHKRDTIKRLLRYGSLVDETGFHLYGEPTGYPLWNVEPPFGDFRLIDKPLETVLAEWINQTDRQISNPNERLKGDLSKIKFTLGGASLLGGYDCSGRWSFEVHGISLQGEWACCPIDGETKVLMMGHHFFSLYPISPNLHTVTHPFKEALKVFLELTDQDFNARPGMLGIYEEMRVPPVFTPSVGVLDDPTLAGLDYNTNA